jgi:hypothetical protein
MSSAANAVAWQWCGESDEFEPFSDSHCATIEAAYQRQGKRALDVKLTIGRHSYRIRHSLKVVGWIRKQFEEPDAVYVQQRVGEASLWRQVQRVGTDESEGEEEQHQGRQAQDRKQAVRPRREAPPSSSSGASTSAAGESAPSASASAGSEGAPGHRPMEVDGRSAAASTGAGASTADPSGLEGCLVRSMLNALSWVRHSSPPHASLMGCLMGLPRLALGGAPHSEGAAMLLEAQQEAEARATTSANLTDSEAFGTRCVCMASRANRPSCTTTSAVGA